MSTTRKGDGVKKGQRYQNSWTYKPRLHETKKSDPSTVQLAGLCPRCREIIEWKIKYDKYKALSAPRKCTLCGGRKVRLAYHHVCRKCSGEKELCGKCGKPARGTEATQRTLTEHSDHQQQSLEEETVTNDCI
ncbi:Uncharacterized protein C9orf85 homolog [Geodia barretti]|uniref:Uncharacterized protein C9orf85 homolog n=1 Tax=Geodia barretti TaxID=519541 RepID=A0AA35W4U2_GEOBA|nr:Uncharacterized protein C9orf85 homolog [Geodia barretti]